MFEIGLQKKNPQPSERQCLGVALLGQVQLASIHIIPVRKNGNVKHLTRQIRSKTLALRVPQIRSPRIYVPSSLPAQAQAVVTHATLNSLP